MDINTARENLQACSPRPTGTAKAHNQILEPVCDLQIVIPAFNVEPYLEDCMNSVLSQKTKYTFRVVLVDDGSTDRTPEIADHYSADPRVTVIHQKNRGFSGARNVALSSIFARYLMFVDSDDMLYEGAIEALLNTAQKHNCDFVEGGAYYLTDDEQTVMYQYNQVCKVSTPADVFHGQPWAKIYNAHLFQNLQFPEGFWYEDSILAFLIWPAVQKAYTIPEMTYIHRRNRQGITVMSQGRPKSVDSYWITEQMLQEHIQAGLPMDGDFFQFLLRQIHLNHYRISDLEPVVQESAFVLSCDLLEQYFSDVLASSGTPLARALKNKDFGMFKMCCKL